MASSIASIRSGPRAAVLGAAVLLLACGQPSPKDRKTMTTTTGNAPQSLLEQGEQALSRGDLAGANARLDEALAAIGTGYQSDRTIDDTGMQLIAANADAKKGDLAAAAKAKARIVKARLQMAARKG